MSPARRSFNLAPTPATDRADDWRDRAACLTVDPEWFFVDGDKWGKHSDDEARAKAVCDGCPAVAECLKEALAQGDGHSIRGGLTPNERDRLRRNANRPTRAQRPKPTKCAKGHDVTLPGARYANGMCVECTRGRNARWRAKQKEAKAS